MKEKPSNWEQYAFGDPGLLPKELKGYSELIGLENLLKLADAAGGKRIYIPKRDGILKYFLVEKIRKEYKEGATITELAKKYDLARSTIHEYVNRK